jgi:hypothetical protein
MCSFVKTPHNVLRFTKSRTITQISQFRPKQHEGLPALHKVVHNHTHFASQTKSHVSVCQTRYVMLRVDRDTMLCLHNCVWRWTRNVLISSSAKRLNSDGGTDTCLGCMTVYRIARMRRCSSPRKATTETEVRALPPGLSKHVVSCRT